MVEKVRRNQFAKNFKALRVSAGLNQVELAKLLGIAQPAVARYESGVREPDLDDLMTIAERLETTPNALLGFEPPPLRASASPRETNIRDINGSFNIVGDGNTLVAPPSSSSSTKRKGKRK